jgi:hypothetical protein
VGRVELENAGTAAWRSHPGTDVHLSYHWLDLRGNPIVWAGEFILLPERVEPGEQIEVFAPVRAPMPPGRYRLAFDLVDEGRLWFDEVGNERLELDVDVLPRLSKRTLAVVVADGPPELASATRAALTRLEEPIVADGAATAFLAAGCRPASDWSRRVLDAHEEGFAAVAGSIDVDGRLGRRRLGSALAPWRSGFGRAPGWERELLCPSLVSELVDSAPWVDPVAGLPAIQPRGLGEPWLCDGRIRMVVEVRALRPDGRRSA